MPGKRRNAYDRDLSADERAAEQRDRILAAAALLYGERGYYDTRVEDIVERAGVSRRTVYLHFEDLDELRFAVFERAIATTLVRLAEIAQDKDNPDRLRAVLTRMFEHISVAPQLGRVVAYELRLPSPRNVALRKQVLSLFAGILMEGTNEDHLDGRVPTPPDELTVYGLLGSFEALANHFLDGSQPIDVNKAVETALRIYRSVYPWRPKSG